jgi:hypothetical protein
MTSFCCFVCLVDRLAVAEAVAAVDGTVVAGLEGDLAGLAALSADSFEHLAGGRVGAGHTLAGITAGLATLGLVGEAFLSVELLLTGGENEFLSAILADQGLVSVHGIPLQLKNRFFLRYVFIPPQCRKCPAYFHSIYWIWQKVNCSATIFQPNSSTFFCEIRQNRRFGALLRHSLTLTTK